MMPLPVRDNGGLRFLRPQDVLYCIVEGSRVFIVTGTGRRRACLTFARLIRHLPRGTFFQSHRAFLGHTVPLSKHRIAELRRRLGMPPGSHIQHVEEDPA